MAVEERDNWYVSKRGREILVISVTDTLVKYRVKYMGAWSSQQMSISTFETNYTRKADSAQEA